MNKSEAWDYVGSLSAPSKMPSVGYSLPASKCKTGARLAKIEGSVCFKCYALRGNYMFASVQACLERRIESITCEHWVDAMVLLIRDRKQTAQDDPKYFRWHDSGDIQSVEHLERIAEIARQCPKVKFWLPTREYQIVDLWCRSYGIRDAKRPSNLIIRLSAHMIDGPLQIVLAKRYGLTVSGVHSKAPSSAQACPAQSQGNKCLTCRACWDKTKFAISYHKH